MCPAELEGDGGGIITPPVPIGTGGGASTDANLGWDRFGRRGSLTPFFQTDPHPGATRRLLLFLFYFAPSAEVGALRWLSLARFGAERGWATDVVTLHPDFMGRLDRTRLSQLPGGVRLFGFSGENPTWYRALLAAWRLRSRGSEPSPHLVSPSNRASRGDARERSHAARGPAWRRAIRSRLHVALSDVFIRRAAELGSALAGREHYDVIVSSGPPHSAHDSARRVATHARVPFVMDMRDPWSDESAVPEEFASATWRREMQKRERNCVSSARILVVTSKAHEDLQASKYPSMRGRMTTVMNGADPEPLPAPAVGRKFVIAFTGMIYLGRDPRSLFRAAARVAREAGATPDDFSVEFMGDDSCNGVPLKTIAAEEGLGAYFHSYGFRPRREALELLARAPVLVSLPLRTEMTLPAKLFEYTRFDAWLLVLAEPHSATARLLEGTGADIVSAADTDAIVRVVGRRFAEFRSGVRPVALNCDGRFDRATQSARMFDALDAVALASDPR